MCGFSGPRIRSTDDGAVVEIVSVEVVEPEPGVTLAGEKEQEASEGSPEHVSETGLLKAPNLEPIVSV